MSAFTNRSCVSVADTVLSTPSGTVTPTRTTAASCAIDEIEEAQSKQAQTMTVSINKRKARINPAASDAQRAPLNRPSYPRQIRFWDRLLSRLVGHLLAAHDCRRKTKPAAAATGFSTYPSKLHKLVGRPLTPSRAPSTHPADHFAPTGL